MGILAMQLILLAIYADGTSVACEIQNCFGVVYTHQQCVLK